MSIYHLHIPRTSGIYIKNNVLPHLITGGVEHFVSNRTFIDVEKIKKSKFVGGHFGLMPIQYMNNPTVFSILRDPVDRFISYFKYTTGLVRMGDEAEKRLSDWLYGDQAEIQSNMQSKFLTGSINIDQFNNDINLFQQTVYNGWYMENYSLDINKIKENIDRFNCYAIEDHEQFKSDLNDVLFKEFGFKTFKYSDKANRSPDIGLELNKSQLDRIKELNSVDMEAYDYVRTIKKRY